MIATYAVLAGSGLPVRNLATLFRYCKIKRIDRVLEFQLDKRRLREAPADASPGEELTAVFQGLKPFPSTVNDVLQTESKQGGTVHILGCSAVVKVEDPEIEHALRTHTKLKNFIESSSPPGWLFIKETSNPNTFVQRCFELGYEVKGL